VPLQVQLVNVQPPVPKKELLFEGRLSELHRLEEPFRAEGAKRLTGAQAALAAAGIRDRFEVVLDSALVGVEKPDPAIFRAALAALGVGPEDALYVGDLYDVDVVGARAAGMEAMLLVPDAAAAGPDCRRIESLVALADDLLIGGRS